MRYYLDTSIWLDYYEKRGKNGEEAVKLILKIMERQRVVCFSDYHTIELKRLNYNLDQIAEMLKIVKPHLLRRIHLQRHHSRISRQLASQRSIPPGDALHALLAKENDATLISRDADFEKLKDICETKKPENIH